MVRILALDTSTAACSAALWRDGALAAKCFEILDRGHAEHLMPMIEKVMTDAGDAPSDLDLVATTVGPGAFTGLRLGLAAARALAMAANVPCLGLTTTETLVAALPQRIAGPSPEEIVAAVLDTKRGDLYAEVFDSDDEPTRGPAAIATDRLAGFLRDGVGEPGNCTLVGDAQALGAAVLREAGWAVRETEVVRPDAAVLAQLAAARWRPGDTPPRPVPLYLRPPDAELPRNGGRLRG